MIYWTDEQSRKPFPLDFEGCVVASNGTFYAATISCKNVPVLTVIKPYLTGGGDIEVARGLRLVPFMLTTRMHVPLISRSIQDTTLTFFQNVYARMAQSEAIVLLHFSPTEMAWSQDAPPQVVDPVSVAPEPHPSPMGYNLMGDIHSHGHYPARHSADDVKSARTLPGIYITFGDITEFNYSVDVMVCTNNGLLLSVNPHAVLQSAQGADFPEEWKGRVRGPMTAMARATHAVRESFTHMFSRGKKPAKATKPTTPVVKEPKNG